MSTMTIEYGMENLRNIKVSGHNISKTKSGKIQRDVLLNVGGRTVVPTQRFWSSLCSKYSTYGLSTKLFRLFDHEEVFSRLNSVVDDNKSVLRYAIEKGESGATDRLLAVSNPSRGLIEHDNAFEVASKSTSLIKDADVTYHNGIMSSTHSSQCMDDFMIGDDAFSPQFMLETPIDGYGSPLIYLSLLRQVCTNGMVGYAKSFRSEIQIGKSGGDPTYALERALDSYSNEEGHMAMRDRLVSATRSWSSVKEVMDVKRTMDSMSGKFIDGESSIIDEHAKRSRLRSGNGNVVSASAKLNRAFSDMTGDLASTYQLTNIDILTNKKQSRLPARCTVYELMNFTTEAATHYCKGTDSLPLQALFGKLITSEYDLEGTMEAKATFQDWFTNVSEN